MKEYRLFQDVKDGIEALIASGACPVGSRLPAERELAVRFGVSRATVREATMALQAEGRVSIRTGAGTFVTVPNASGAALPKVTAFELTEARSVFEAEIAALAAPVIDEASLQQLEALLAEMVAHDGDDARVTAADRAFHALIANAAANAAMVHVVNSLWSLRDDLPDVRTAHLDLCRSDADARHQEHKAIIDALRSRDPQAARQAMRDHFNRLLLSLLDANEQNEFEKVQRRLAENRQHYMRTVR